VGRRYEQGVRMRDAVDGQVDDEGCPRCGAGARGSQDKVVQGAASADPPASWWKSGEADPREAKVLAQTEAEGGHDEAAEAERIGSKSPRSAQ